MNSVVLLIEDNEQNRYLATFLLEQRGHRVIAAENGMRGIDLARRTRPSVILLDIQLPTMDGYDVARELRSHPETRVTPIIAVTSYAMPGDRERALAAGCSGYIEKPINPDTFVDHVEAALSLAEKSAPRDPPLPVLVVDDKDENIEYLAALLGANGYEVTSARNGLEALERARVSPPGLVVSDLLMPVMDGYSLLRQWRADERLRAIPFVVYTATYTEPEDEQLAFSLGADGFILKPCEPELFITRLMDARRRGPPSPVTGRVPEPPDEVLLLREYNETLVRKLEQKAQELQEANRQLQADLEARRRAECALAASEEKFRQLAESIDDVFFLIDLQDWTTQYVSPAYQTVWGTDPHATALRTIDWLDAVHPQDRARLEDARARAALGPWDDTYRIQRPDGSSRWVRTRTFPVRGASGAVYRVAGVARDVSEYRRLEEQLRQAQKMEAVGRLAGGIAHDFNNLLSVILSYTSLALSALPEGDPCREDMLEVERAGERATELTRELLAFSRKQVMEPKVLELSRLVQNMEKILRRLVGEDIDMRVIAPDLQERIYADPNQLEQVVMNLVVNARDAMPKGGRLTIEVRRVEVDPEASGGGAGLRPGPHLQLTVSDNGAGMDTETRERAFEPFFTTKEAGKGTGLGLSTVFGIIKQNHGHIELYSELGVGTTFKIYLPCTERAEQPATSRPPEPSSLAGSETVLLVEDDAQVRASSREILRRRGYHVLEASGAEEALRLAAEYAAPIHLLLTDVIMPGMSGRELAERLSATHPDTRVLYVSGYTEGAIVHHGVLDEGIAFLQKPLSPTSLLRRVREVLGGSPGPTA